MGILASERGLAVVSLPRPSEREALQDLGEAVNQAVRSPKVFADLIERLKAYFRGERVSFPDKLDLSAATPFQRAVWEATRLIPRGETRSYLQVAAQIGRPEAVRAVGNALGRNPLPIIIPCHRVVAAGGGLGGFGGGLKMKVQLLNLEGSSAKRV